VDVTVNRHIFDYDLVLILGPVFPHEVAGFSGGDKYLFPGIAGGKFLHFTHWLGAMVTCWDTIGIKHTPVREALTCAAGLVSVPRLCVSMVVKARTELAGLFVGDTETSWSAAADLSAQMHIVYKEKPFHTVLGSASPMYNELWVAGKVMYKLEPVAADGGTLIIYGKHITCVSESWGDQIARVGYHTCDYFLNNMNQFRDIPGGVLAHSTHVKGLGTLVNGVEKSRINVVLATSISEEECRAINLGYLDPDSINLDDYKKREDEGILFVEHAGEILHRLKGK
jgi:nickel-dependent lactate racemase